jgi:hypothetical protein
VIVVVFGFKSTSGLVRFLCWNLFIPAIGYYMHREVFGIIRVHFMYTFWMSFILFIVFEDIAHAAHVQTLACKEPPGNRIED